MYLQRLIFPSLTVLSITELCTTPKDEEGECILFKACHILVDLLKKEQHSAVEYLQKSTCGFNKTEPLVCCPSNKTESPLKPANNPMKRNLLPDRRYCGYQHSDDYFRNGSNTAINEFPWQAILLYNVSSTNCAGTLISNKYVLTAALCVLTFDSTEVIGVRLGEYNTETDTDCTKDAHFDECSDSPQDFGIQKKFVHPNFYINLSTHYVSDHNIGLLRLDRKLQYTDYIRPICLPFPETKFAKLGDILVSSGFGLDANRQKTDIKKKILLELITNNECLLYYSYYFDNPYDYINENSFCTRITEASKEISCYGDGGGSVMYSHRNQWHIEGISSFGSSTCEGQIPEVHTKVSKYLNWILENVEP